MRWLAHPLTLVLMLLICLAGYLSLPNDSEKNGRRGGAVPVKTLSAERVEFRDIIEALGTAQANESVTLTATVSDIVEKVLFDDGQQVKQGDLLLVLQHQEELAKIAELQAQLDEAKRQLMRIKNLQREEATSEQLLDEQAGKVKTIYAQLDVAKTRLEEMNIRAPFNGSLGIRQVSPGALLKSGEAITSLDDTSVIKVDFSVSEAFLPAIAVSQKIKAKSVAYNQPFEGVIVAIDSRVDPVTRSVQVRAVIDNADAKLRAGMLLKIELEKSIEQVLLIPEGALVPINDRQHLYLVKADNKVERIEVEIGRRRVGEVEIVSGLNLGDQVVVEGTLRLSPGAQVNVLGAD